MKSSIQATRIIRGDDFKNSMLKAAQNMSNDKYPKKQVRTAPSKKCRISINNIFFFKRTTSKVNPAINLPPIIQS